MLFAALSLLYIGSTKPRFLELTIAQDQHADLVQRCREGDALSFRKLYEHYARAMYNTSLRIVNNAAEAEDILQESFIDAFHNIAGFENRSSFGAWLKQIVINKSINQLKKKKISLVEIERAGVEDQREEEAMNEQDIQWQVAKIKQAIQQLPAGYRTVLSLYLLEGYDHEEIAGIIGVAESTTRTQYIRAKQKLLNIIKGGV
ncbi:MAG: RNA polymerase sigma factor [Chitinophagaceae bacterium]|nr:RNA polymerase sigma factor [Chitinophagaceae bacterium]